MTAGIMTAVLRKVVSQKRKSKRVNAMSKIMSNDGFTVA